jgi:hypothetical protein
MSDALKTAIEHIEHMAAWITTQKAGYSFEALGEDMPGIRDAVAQAVADKARLDFLDEANRRLNAYSGTTYRWKLIFNHLVNRLMLGHLAVDLHDQDARGHHSCRGAIDEEMQRVARDRTAS